MCELDRLPRGRKQKTCVEAFLTRNGRCMKCRKRGNEKVLNDLLAIAKKYNLFWSMNV